MSRHATFPDTTVWRVTWGVRSTYIHAPSLRAVMGLCEVLEYGTPTRVVRAGYSAAGRTVFDEKPRPKNLGRKTPGERSVAGLALLIYDVLSDDYPTATVATRIAGTRGISPAAMADFLADVGAALRLLTCDQEMLIRRKLSAERSGVFYAIQERRARRANLDIEAETYRRIKEGHRKTAHRLAQRREYAAGLAVLDDALRGYRPRQLAIVERFTEILVGCGYTSDEAADWVRRWSRVRVPRL